MYRFSKFKTRARVKYGSWEILKFIQYIFHISKINLFLKSINSIHVTRYVLNTKFIFEMIKTQFFDASVPDSTRTVIRDHLNNRSGVSHVTFEKILRRYCSMQRYPPDNAISSIKIIYWRALTILNVVNIISIPMLTAVQAQHLKRRTSFLITMDVSSATLKKRQQITSYVNASLGWSSGERL